MIKKMITSIQNPSVKLVKELLKKRVPKQSEMVENKSLELSSQAQP